jgi:hypothetical protein
LGKLYFLDDQAKMCVHGDWTLSENCPRCLEAEKELMLSFANYFHQPFPVPPSSSSSLEEVEAAELGGACAEREKGPKLSPSPHCGLLAWSLGWLEEGRS